MDMDILNIPLNNNEILQKIDNCKFILYENMHKIKSIYELLPKTLILYQIYPNYGHFCCVFQNDEGINFFDPIGLIVDKELNIIEVKRRHKTYQNYPYLTKLLYNYNDGKKIIYNQYKLQHTGTATCGYFCAIRLYYSNLSNDEFHDAYKPYKGYEKEIRTVKLFYQL